MLDPANYKTTAIDETRKHREYMLTESLQQFEDYYETDPEEQGFIGEYLETVANRDRIRFMEIYKDYTEQQHDDKEYVMIRKREYNPELSVFSNMLLDM